MQTVAESTQAKEELKALQANAEDKASAMRAANNSASQLKLQNETLRSSVDAKQSEIQSTLDELSRCRIELAEAKEQNFKVY